MWQASLVCEIDEAVQPIRQLVNSIGQVYGRAVSGDVVKLKMCIIPIRVMEGPFNKLTGLNLK